MRGFLILLLVAGAAYWMGRSGRALPLDPVLSESPHAAYDRKLQEAGLHSVALGRHWTRLADRVLEEAPVVEAPFREAGYLDPRAPDAVAYRFRARPGQRLRFTLELEPPTNAQFFMDVFRPPENGTAKPRRVASAASAARELEYTPSREGEYVVRVQPELLRGGRYVLTAMIEPTLGFPVDGAGMRSVHSFFGDARDGGSRNHHGIDIFAPRGTPVLAAARGRVARVNTTPRGGRVIWLRDEMGNSLYYAHLEDQLVRDGQQVGPGDTLGLVGNSGNARSTPPHLHFGVYRRGRGPMDPVPFVQPVPGLPRDPSVELTDLGGWRRVAGEGVRLRSAPNVAAPMIAELPRLTPLRVVAASDEWYRARLPDGREGFVAGRLTERTLPLRSEPLAVATPLHDRPGSGAASIAALPAGERVDVLGRFGDYLLVRAAGREAWLEPRAGN